MQHYISNAHYPVYPTVFGFPVVVAMPICQEVVAAAPTDMHPVATWPASQYSSGQNMVVPRSPAVIAPSHSVRSTICQSSNMTVSVYDETGTTSNNPPCRLPGCSKRAHENPDGTFGDFCSRRHQRQCLRKGCKQEVYCSPDGALGDYCSKDHMNRGENICIECFAKTVRPEHIFCSQTCMFITKSKGPILLKVPAGHKDFDDVRDQFYYSWTDPNSPCVKHIFKIMYPEEMTTAYHRYKRTIEARSQFAAFPPMSAGNEAQSWHGTNRECLLGERDRSRFCISSSCSLCCVIKSSFDIGFVKTNVARFGRGIYTSPSASKASSYSRNFGPAAATKLKALLLNKVVIGKGHLIHGDHPSYREVTSPPPGFDSLVVGKGNGVKDDEYVVFTNDAIRPSFLVMYEDR
ncbi:hypothetical protein HHX47_DHR2000569 [Lentinula edodes]|nr:hypothetical protein HHX47_DHR2000569 [Lentinula edodes]